MRLDHKSAPVIISVILGIILVLIFVSFRKGSTHPDRPDLEVRANQPPKKEAVSQQSSNLSSKKSSERFEPDRQGEPLKKASMGSLYSLANDLLTRHEASRSQLLLTTKHNGEIWYLVGIPEPTPEEVRSIRAEVAKLQRQVPSENTQKFDEMLQKLIKDYDPFGVEGQRCVLIRVPEEDGKRVYGMTFTSDNFERDIEMVSAGNLSVPNAKLFAREDGKVPERFGSLVK